MKNTYICRNCKKEFQRYSSTVRNPDSVFCCKACQGMFYKTYMTGENNPNYKGIHCVVCECGRTKDYRAIKCSLCANVGYCIGEPKISDELIIKTVSEKSSISEVANELKCSRNFISKKIDKLSIDISHFSPCSHRPIPNEKLFVKRDNKSKRRNSTLKKRLIEENIKEECCEACGQPSKWQGKKLELELHHKNGNSCDDRIENLQFLCPNCHSQTKTFRGKNAKKRKEQ